MAESKILLSLSDMETNTINEFEIKQLKNRTGKTGSFDISKITVFTTKEYDQFKILKGNRKIDTKRVEKLANEMRLNDLHPHRPIMVDEDFGIIEGQHTFSARKLLGRPVYFTICQKQDTTQIAGFNNAVKQWRMEDYLDAYTNTRKPEYIKFRSWIEKHEITINVGLCFMGSQSATSSKSFKDGSLRFIPEEDTEMAINLLKEMSTYNNDTRRKSHLARACSVVTNAHGYDEQRMFSQLEKCKDKIDIGLNIMDAIRQLEEFYNYNFPMGPNYLRLM